MGNIISDGVRAAASVVVVGEVTSVAKFIDPHCGDKVNSNIGLSYRPARLHGLAGRYGNPLPESTLSPSQGSINSAAAFYKFKRGVFILFYLALWPLS